MCNSGSLEMDKIDLRGGWVIPTGYRYELNQILEEEVLKIFF